LLLAGVNKATQNKIIEKPGYSTVFSKTFLKDTNTVARQL